MLSRLPIASKECTVLRTWLTGAPLLDRAQFTTTLFTASAYGKGLGRFLTYITTNKIYIRAGVLVFKLNTLRISTLAPSTLRKTAKSPR